MGADWFAVVLGFGVFMLAVPSGLQCAGFGAQGMQVSPAWAVGGFFVPIIHLFLPYQAVKEIWVNGPVDSEPDSI